MYYINQLDYPHIRYEHDLDNGGAPEEKCTAAAAACGPCCLCMIVENMTFGHLELTDCLELSAKLGANRQRGTSLKILGPAVAEKYGLTYDTTNISIAINCCCTRAVGNATVVISNDSAYSIVDALHRASHNMTAGNRSLVCSRYRADIASSRCYLYVFQQQVQHLAS